MKIIMRRLFATLLVIHPLMTAVVNADEMDHIIDLPDVRDALRINDYATAVEFADTIIEGGDEGIDEALYLKGLALHHAGEHGSAIRTLDQLITGHANSTWFRKARFLKTDSLVELRRFEEAETILADEAQRLLSADRKKELAGLFIRFADDLATEPDPSDVGAPPADYHKAYKFYQQALAMEIDRTLRDDVLFKLALAAQQAGNHGQAIQHLHEYLRDFDPHWAGPVGSLARLRGLLRETPVARGTHVFGARYHLGKSQLAMNQWHAARQNFEDLHGLLLDADDEALGQQIANTSWQIVRSYHMPGVEASELEKTIAVATAFLARHRAHRHSVEAAWLIGQTWQQYGRADDAVDAYEAFLAGDMYRLPEGERASEMIERLGKSAIELEAEWRPAALYQIGALRHAQRQYPRAIEAWQRYVAQFPNGPHWAAAQRQIIDSQFLIAVDEVAEERYDDARRKLTAFLAANPLDSRAPQVLFILGEVEHSQENWQRAITEWEKLISKYPNTEESSLALYRTGVILEEKLDRLEDALEAYRRLTWGSYAAMAHARIAVMTQKQLELETERTFRTTETPQVRIATRNIEKLTVRQYFLDPEAYFRKTHTIGGVEALDIALIEPDKTWEVEINSYAKYKPLEQTIEVPFTADRPGVCILNVAEDDWEATTLLVRSDLDLISRTSRREAIVFVQNMLDNSAAEDVTLLFSDGREVFATETTGGDGVFHGAFEELESLDSLRVFAIADGHIASNALSLQGLSLSQGLSSKGYVYTDRPAYQPGQVVHVRGVLRDVDDGSYIVPQEKTYVVSVSDPQGRLLREEERVLSGFGSFETSFALAPAASVGGYTITAREKDTEGTTYTGHFQVEQFQLQKMELSFDFERDVYYRGEVVEATLRAQYYWGEPVVNRSIRYHLPDGRSFVERTDDEGALRITFDTAGVMPGSVLPFQATLEGEDVYAAGFVHLPQYGFNVSVVPSQDLALAGEPFDVTVSTTTPSGDPIGRELTLFVLRRQTTEPDPVLQNVPWVSVPRAASAEVTVEEVRVTTDDETGRGTVRLTLADGGTYILRAAGQDRFDQTVLATGGVTVSDDDDATRLRIFADSNTLKVGEDTSFRLHSRVKAGLALITFEGESILDYRVINIAEGHNAIPLTVGHEHFPNFAVSATMMEGRDLRAATKPFNVERELRITIKPLQQVYAPGATGVVELLVTDQRGRPVEAELSLALVNQAILAQYPDQTPEIRSFFQHGARRFVEFRTGATNAFAYDAQTRATVKAFTEEAERLARAASERDQLADAAVELGRLAELRARSGGGGRGRPAPQRGLSQEMILGDPGDEDDVALRRQSRGSIVTLPDELNEAYKQWAVPEVEGKAIRYAEDWSSLSDRAADKNAYFFGQFDAGLIRAGETVLGEPRRERPEAGWWDGSIITNAQGKATVHVPMPESTTKWQLVARGATVETLVGQSMATVTTREDFFIEIKSPRAAMEGDAIQVLARLHDLTGYEGPVGFQLIVSSGEKTFTRLTETINLVKGEAAEVLFDAFDVPAVGVLDITVAATTRQGETSLSDAVTTGIVVQPYGIQYAAHGGGAGSGSARLLLTLPDDMTYASRWLTVAVGPDLQQRIIDMALSARPIIRAEGGLQPPPIPGAPRSYGHTHGSELLAAVSGLRYAGATNTAEADRARLRERVRSLVSALIATQHQDGGWSWGGWKRHDFSVTATSYWALSAARSQGITVSDSAMDRAAALLSQLYQQAASADHEQKAILLHALSVEGHADFKLANSLYRDRNALSPVALAYTALTLANLNREDMATEVLAVLESHAVSADVAGRRLASWGEPSQYHTWLNDRVETTAVALLALMEVRPTATLVEPAAQYLLQQHGCFGFANGRSRGPGVAALAQYFEQGQFADADFELSIAVNGEHVRRITGDGSTPLVIFDIAAEKLQEGENEIAFDFQGRGGYAYAATLRGFSSQFKDPRSFRGPYLHSRRYHHAPLEYRGVELSATSTSPVKNLEIGQRTRVYVDVYDYGYGGYMIVEESLPAGATLVPGSIQGGGFSHHEVRDGKIIMYIPNGGVLRDYSYELVGYATGEYRTLPTVIRDAFDPSRMRVHKPAEINVLAPGEASDDPYEMNDAERYALGRAYFNDGLYREALGYLWPLFDRDNKYQERDVARMLLWSYTTEDHFNADRVVAAFELLSVRHPDLNIPFNRILRVGEAYRYIGEFERAWLVYRATIESSFRNDSMISAVLEDEGQMLASFAYQENLWWEYPDIADVAASYFALAQTIYDESPNAHRLAANKLVLPGLPAADEAPEEAEPVTRVSMLVGAIQLLDEFLALYPRSPLRDDAAFSMTNAFLDLKDYEAVVRLAGAHAEQFADSDFETSFQYMEALGWFWQRAYSEALEAARIVADGDSRDRDFARYILGQIYHAEGQPGQAIGWYEKVSELYPDAGEAIEYFRRKAISLDEVSIFKPGEPVEIALDYRNIKDTSLQVYKVDLMKLYLREKNLSNITEVNLAGIAPQLVTSFELGDGLDYVDKERTAQLDLTEEGAYLVICRGDNLFASGLVLITPLEIEVQEDAASGRVRVNLTNAVDAVRPAEVHVKVIGSASGTFESGETDLRGIFVADGVSGTVTAIARDADARYAFYRGETWIGAPQAPQAGQQIMQQRKAPAVDYNMNLRQQQMELQLQNRADFDAYRRGGSKGVEVQKAK